MVTALGAAVGVVGVSGAGTAAAQPVPHTLKYICHVPMINKDLPFRVKVDADIPESVPVGEPSRKFAIGARTTVAANFTTMLHAFSVQAVEGTVAAKIRVAAPQDNRRVPVPLNITKTRIPPSGSFEVGAKGTAPSLTFRRPGPARITAGDLTVHVIAKRANGEVLEGPTVRCTPDTGQDKTVGSFEITKKGTRAGTGAGTGAGTDAGTTTGSATSGASDAHTKGMTAAGAQPEGASAARRSAQASDATHGTGKGAVAAADQATRSLMVPVAGTLLAGALAFALGSRVKRRRRGAGDA
ncbi:DUF6801 domain-containing protein [Streptomyces tubercidicus]|uniref:DUF6801 domain-containing protein n=1 Tax=Streptomyces tubercidicus TaxID=47759 RepID=UPI0036C8392A